jgi:hypothetical protein
LRKLTANEAAQRLVQFIFRYGVPEIILSDQGTNFQSQVLTELWDLLDVRRARTSPLHPQTDGLSERFNQTLRKMLAAFVSVKQNDWDSYLAPLCFAYNTAVHATTRCTPFELMFGRTPKVPLDLVLPSVDVDLCLDPEEYAAKIKDSLRQAYAAMEENREVNVERSKLNYDRKVTAANFELEDSVWVFRR